MASPMIADISILVPATQLAVDITTAKTYCRIDGEDEDEMLIGIIRAVTREMETMLRRSLLSQTICTIFELRPPKGTALYGAVESSSQWLRLDVPRPPVTAVSLVEVETVPGTWQALAASTDYRVLAAGQGVTTVTLGWTVFSLLDITLLIEVPVRIRVTYTAGYSDPSRIPPDYTNLILQTVALRRLQLDDPTVSADTGVAVASRKIWKI